MATDSLQDFQDFRPRMNDLILGKGNLTINRFFALDSRAYEPVVLGGKTKELLGLVASLVLRCEGATDEELLESFAVGLVVGGSIVIPHLRRAVSRLEEIRGTAI